MQGSMPMKGQSFISRFLREIELPESIRFCIWRLMASEEREADMNIQVRTSSGITLVPLETRLMAGRKFEIVRCSLWIKLTQRQIGMIKIRIIIIKKKHEVM